MPATPDDSVRLATSAIADAGRRGALIICFPECFVPGYRWPGVAAPPPDPVFLERAWTAVADAAARAGVGVVLGTERVTDRGLQITALVIDPNGAIVGWQDKGQLDPSEQGTYPAFGTARRVFTVGSLTFGVVICHEGWRYPETARWAVRQGARLVFHPHAHVAEPGSYRPVTFGDPANTFHEKAMLCRAAENTCFFASVNCASEGSGTTSAVIRPDGTVQSYHPYGHEGLLVADVDLSTATGLLASRCRVSSLSQAATIARVWSARTTEKNARAYREHFAEHVVPQLKATEGCIDAALQTRADDHGVEIVVTTWWRSLQAIGAFAGADLEQAVVADEAKALLTTWDERVRHYQILVHS